MSSRPSDEENFDALEQQQQQVHASRPLQRSVTDWLRTDNVRSAALTACSIIQKTPTARTPSNYSREITSLRETATDDAGPWPI